MKSLIKNQYEKESQKKASQSKFQIEIEVKKEAQCCAKTSKNVPGCHD